MKRQRVGFQGERGAFSEVAAQKMRKGKLNLVPFPSFPAMFRALAARKVDYATVPIENTLAGSVHENYDLLLKHRLPILAETNIRIVHNLIAAPGATLRTIHKVYSHPVALRQCIRFLEKHGKWEVVPFYDTAGSVKMILEKKLQDSAAIASKAAAQVYGGRILVKDIGDDRENYTRFFLLGPRSAANALSTGKKTSIVFVTRNLPGSLFRCLSVFALRDIDLTKIESRPLRGRPWEYLFYLDFQGNPSDPSVRNALKNLSEITEFLRVLGCYPTIG
ncbi:MAG: prephenate dehydratase [Acidobacteria bacterium]|nr:prephenate dehydratase [Acidobacteriota bacterium]